MESDFFTVREVAAMLRMCIVSVRRKIKAGEIQAIKTGKALIISRKAIEGFLRAHKVGDRRIAS